MKLSPSSDDSDVVMVSYWLSKLFHTSFAEGEAGLSFLEATYKNLQPSSFYLGFVEHKLIPKQSIHVHHLTVPLHPLYVPFKDSNDGDGTKDNPFFVSNEESSNDENDGDLFFHPSSSRSLSDAPDLFSSEIISDVHNGISSDKNNQASLPSTQVSHDLVRTEHPLQTLQCILKSEENFTNIWNKYLLKIDLHPWRVENDEESLLQKFAQ
ncbi:6565_t:CDS:2, partial [Entrophospora sp. SA101]